MQHDFHMAGWLKSKFNLTVKSYDYAMNRSDWWLVYRDSYDLDILCVTSGPSIFDAALEYGSCHGSEKFCDALVAIETGAAS